VSSNFIHPVVPCVAGYEAGFPKSPKSPLNELLKFPPNAAGSCFGGTLIGWKL